MSPSTSPAEEFDKFFGFKDIALLCANTVTGLFPLGPQADDDASSISSQTEGHREENPVEALAEWVAYVLYRTLLPQSTIFHALHLILRLSVSGAPLPEAFDPITDSDTSKPPNTLHYRLLLAAMTLATSYAMDDAYSNRSWTIASKFLFPRTQIDAMEIGLFRALDWRLAAEGERLDEIVQRYIDDFEESQLEKECLRKSEEDAARLHETALRREAKMIRLLGPEVVNASFGRAEDERDVWRASKMRRLLGAEVGTLYASTPAQFAAVVQDIPTDDIVPLVPTRGSDDEESPPVPVEPLFWTPTPRRKLRKRTTSSSGSSARRPSSSGNGASKRRRASQSPAPPSIPTPPTWARFDLAKRSASVTAATLVNVVAVGTPALSPSGVTAADACHCALEAGNNKTASKDAAGAAYALPCRWCLIQRAKTKLAHARPFVAPRPRLY